MTEAGWERGRIPGYMIRSLDWNRYKRKLRLFVAAYCRPLLTGPDDHVCRVLDLLELHPGKLTGLDELQSAVAELEQLPQTELREAVVRAARAAFTDTYAKWWYENISADLIDWQLRVCVPDDLDKPQRSSMKQQLRAEQASLLRDIVGNPFRPVAFDPGWRIGTAVALARQMYDARDFDLLPVLADALEEAGCDAAELLAHCRGPGPHVRGCWAVDLVLGKT